MNGFDELRKSLDTLQKAAQDLHGQLGTVQFDVDDPASIEAAVSTVNAMIDAKLAPYSGEGMVEAVGDQLKAAYREAILDKARAHRLKQG